MAIEKKRVDEDWKRQVEREKEQLAGNPSSHTAAHSPANEASTSQETSESFLSIINQIAAQAMLGLGQIEDPRTGTRGMDLELARQFIDQLGALELRTRNNLSQEEQRMLQEVIHSLRVGYVELSRAEGAQKSPGAPPR